MAVSASEPLTPAAGRRETLLAALLALLLGLFVVGRPVWDKDLVYLATDTATVQAPWNIQGPALNRELSDSAVAFYPHYRRVAESWRQGEAPLWNPDIFVGVPLLANAQWGALDPQVLALVVLDSLGGVELFDRGFAWLAMLRVAAAALGTYLLARRLALTRGGASLAALGFALSGSTTLWLGFSLAHVTPLLPWVLLGIEGFRGERRGGGAWLLTSLSMALAIYGGHPEVAFFVGLSAGLWSLTLLPDSARALGLALLALLTGVLLAAPVLLPFVEYLQNSGALLAHELSPSLRGRPDLVSLGALVVLVGFLWKWREVTGRSTGESTVGRRLLSSLPLVLVFWAWAAVSSARGFEFDLALAPCESIEAGSMRLPAPVMLLALVAFFSGIGLPRGRWLMLMGGLSTLIALGAPALVELWRWLPLVGLAAPQRAACVAALFLSLLAGAVMGQGRPAARWAAVLSFSALALVAFMRSETQALDPQEAELDTPVEYVTFAELPPAVLESGTARIDGELGGDLDVDELRLELERLGPDGKIAEEADFSRRAVLVPTNRPGIRAFEFGDLDLRALGPGDWRPRLEFLREGQLLGALRPALVHIPRSRTWSLVGLVLFGLAALLVLMGESRSAPFLLMVVTALGGVWLARDWNPAVERERHLVPTRTGALLTERFTGERILCEPGIYPGDTAMLTGASTIDGYDAMDVASFDGYRAHALQAGASPLLDWNLNGMQLTSPAFRLFGVRALLLHDSRVLDGWRQIAGPEGAQDNTEVFVYEAMDPLPRAFCVPSIVSRESALEAGLDLDPRQVAFLSGDSSFELEDSFESSVVRTVERSRHHQEYEVELDGEGLFLCTEQHFPGWQVEVNGQEREVLRVNSIFRGVFLTAGTHRVRFEYRPESWRLGKLLGGLGLLALVAGLGLVRRLGRTPTV